MKHRPTSPGHWRANRQRFTPLQMVILILAGLLGLGWVAAGTVFVTSYRPPAQAAAPAAQPELPTRTAAPLLAGESAAPPTPPVRCAQQTGSARQGIVTRMLEPGVLEVSLDGAAYPVRLAGITLPPGGPLQDQLSLVMQQAESQTVLLVKDVSEQDAAGRLVRYVFVGGQFLNDALVRQGLALADPGAPDQSCAALLQQAEAQARAVRAGLWQPTPAPTSTFMPFVTLDPAAHAACDCSKKYECSDFSTHAEAQTCFNACNDYNSKLDPDRDGLACEALP